MKMLAFDRDPYLTKLETAVTDARQDGSFTLAITADSLFYPEGGGQPSDRGTLGGSKVLDVRRVGEVIHHILETPTTLGPTTMLLDWTRRFDHMQQHTGQHLLTAVAADRFGWKTTAFHLGDKVSDIELNTPDIDSESLKKLEESVNAIIREAKTVRARTVTLEEYSELTVRTRGLPEGHIGAVRLIEIEGVDLNTCGGTHLRSTSELGSLCLLSTEKLRGGTRVFFVAGARVRRRMEEHESRTAHLRKALDASNEHLVEEAGRRETQLRSLTKELKGALEELAGFEAVRLASEPRGVIAAHWKDRDMAFLQTVAHDLVGRAPAAVALLTAGADADGVFLLAAGKDATLDIPALGATLAEVLGGRGGGRGTLFQGKASRLDRRKEALDLLETV